MIGAWGQGLTEELFDKDTRAVSACRQQYDQEITRITALEDMKADNGGEPIEGFQTFTSGSRLEKERGAASDRFTLCKRSRQQALAWNQQSAQQSLARRQDAILAAQARLYPTADSGRGKLSLWLLPLLALLPLGFILFRRKT